MSIDEKQRLWMISFGERLRAVRESRKMTQLSLARICGIHQNSISKYESGNTVPNAYVLYKMCKALNVGKYELLGVADEKDNRNNASSNVRLNRLL